MSCSFILHQRAMTETSAPPFRKKFSDTFCEFLLGCLYLFVMRRIEFPDLRDEGKGAKRRSASSGRKSEPMSWQRSRNRAKHCEDLSGTATGQRKSLFTLPATMLCIQFGCQPQKRRVDGI